MMPLFITSSGTGIGKTAITTSLCWQLRQRGREVAALKPVVSGYDPMDPGSDSALILSSCGITPSPEAMATISPWRYHAPLAPNMAAALEGGEVELEKLVAYCREYEALAQDVLLVEGVGGVMVPINGRHTVLDWMKALGWPVLLVVGSYLGAVSHALTAITVLQTSGLSVKAVLLSESEGSSVGVRETADTLQQFVPAGVPVVKLWRVQNEGELWKHMPPISWLCDE